MRVRWSEGVTIDPVCLMIVEKEKTSHVLEYDGQKDYFCSAECQREFEANPKKYKDVHISF
ncbi:MAG: hypothetical protein A2137_07155 [Chloroflexi bacterium RBG_16_58_8]|nr:MAG: hypothetical protein A2137_07155 [Chloroflexi bacterium RBG_16_58_8]